MAITSTSCKYHTQSQMFVDCTYSSVSFPHHTQCLLTDHTESKAFHTTHSSVSFPHHTQYLLTDHTESKAFYTTHSSVSFPHHTQCLLTVHTVQ